ncbi:MAG: hypothetical protein OXQ29_16465 [Rhodospirillaceae bacterium]|nr:hypothetical protein [Rhodospirillaceae bacterium]
MNEFNKVYQYFTYQGGWASMSPDDVTAAKREADRLVYMNSFLWTAKFLRAYEGYKKVAFVENQGRGRAFLFRGNVERYRENSNWSESWKSRFVLASDRVERAEFTKAYDEMMDLAVRDLGIVSDTGEEGG